MELVIILLIGLINVFAVYMTTKFLNGIDAKAQFRFVLIGFGVIYIATLILFTLASSSFEIVSDITNSKNMIIFSMVPINIILFLPYTAKIYCKKKENKLSYQQLKKRYVILGILIVLAIVFEYFYLKSSIGNIISYLN